MNRSSRPRSAATPRVSGLSPWLFACLLAALLVAPWLGSVHAVLHGKTAASALVSVANAHVTGAVGATDAIGAATDGALKRLFGGHTHDGDCRLYDQLSHADGLHLVVAPPVVLLPPVATLAWDAGECLRRWAALFDARGPPFLA